MGGSNDTGIGGYILVSILGLFMDQVVLRSFRYFLIGLSKPSSFITVSYVKDRGLLPDLNKNLKEIIALLYLRGGGEGSCFYL